MSRTRTLLGQGHGRERRPGHPVDVLGGVDRLERSALVDPGGTGCCSRMPSTSGSADRSPMTPRRLHPCRCRVEIEPARLDTDLGAAAVPSFARRCARPGHRPRAPSPAPAADRSPSSIAVPGSQAFAHDRDTARPSSNCAATTPSPFVVETRIRRPPSGFRRGSPGPRSATPRPATGPDARHRHLAAGGQPAVSTWETRTTSCSMIGPSSRSSVT